MKYTIHLLILFLLIAGAAPAGTLVNFGSVDPNNLGVTQNIGTTYKVPIVSQNSYTIDNVSFSFSADPVALDPGLIVNGLCPIGGVGPGCVGAQVDSSGVYGTTDGTLAIQFLPNSAFGLHFGYSLVGFDFNPALDTFSLTALLFNGGEFVSYVTQVGTPELVPETTTYYSTGQFDFSTGDSLSPFDLAVINFTPTYKIDDITGQPNFGKTTFAIDGATFSYDPVPEPEAITLFGCGMLVIGGSRLIRRRR